MPDRSSIALGLFDDASWARQALAALKAVGFASEDISVLEGKLAAPRRRAAQVGLRRQWLLPPGTGSLATAFVRTGMSEERAGYYADKIHRGNWLLAVRILDGAALAETILCRCGAYDVVLTRSGGRFS